MSFAFSQIAEDGKNWHILEKCLSLSHLLRISCQIFENVGDILNKKGQLAVPGHQILYIVLSLHTHTCTLVIILPGIYTHSQHFPHTQTHSNKSPPPDPHLSIKHQEGEGGALASKDPEGGKEVMTVNMKAGSFVQRPFCQRGD